MSNKKRGKTLAFRIARMRKENDLEQQQRLHNDKAVFFTMQVKSQPENKDLTFQEYCNDTNIKPLNKSKIKWRNIK